MCCLGRCYRWVAALPPRRVAKLPADIADEIMAALLHLPLAVSDLRSPVSSHIYCSDATPSTAGSASAVTSQSAAEALYCHAEHKGFYTR